MGTRVFQDRLVMTTSISLRKYDATACIIFTEPWRWGSASLLVESTSHTPLGDRQACLSGVECGYLRRRRTIPLMHTVHFHRIFNFFSAMPRYDYFATFTDEKTCRLMHIIDTNSIFSVSYSTIIIPICQAFIEKSHVYILNFSFLRAIIHIKALFGI